MQKWQQIEDKINEILEKVISKSGEAVSKKTPDRLKKNAKSARVGLKAKVKKNSKSFKKTIVEGSKKSLSKAKNIKETSQAFVKKAKEDSLSEIKEKGLIVALIAFVTPTIIKLKQWLSSLESTTIVGFVSVTTIFSLTGLNIYKQSKKIAEEKAKEAEQVEEVQGAKAVSTRPKYHKKQEKTFIVYDIILPAYFEKNKMSKLVIDFSIESSNKYIKAFFLENPHYVNDVLNSKIEPISVDFPLREEGKIIVKDKIKQELNELIKKLKINGEITEVNIHKIVGG